MSELDELQLKLASVIGQYVSAQDSMNIAVQRGDSAEMKRCEAEVQRLAKVRDEIQTEIDRVRKLSR